VLTKEEARHFERADRFLSTVRCHIHYLTGRADDRLSFDLQREIASRLGYQDRPGSRGVERFTKHYYLHAKTVGDLTRIFVAALEDSHRRKPKLAALWQSLRPRQLEGFRIDGERLAAAGPDAFEKDPVAILRLFHVAQDNGLDIHPATLRLITQNLRLLDRLRNDPEANRLFMAMLTSRHDPETTLRRLNEAGVFGRFVPDFGRVVAQMQFDMYHHYTVDEHSIRAIGLLAGIERGDLKDDHPLSTAIVRQIASRRVLYVAVLLHDIAKGRGGDHSVIGAEIALKLCPRFGLDPAETETVSWLVRYHLLMSSTAFKRDLADPKTIEDFARQVQSPERLRLLLILTVVDIRAVGPNVWNEWKRMLLRTLFEAAEERLRLGHKQHGRAELVQARQKELAAELGWKASAIRAHAKRLPDSYWLAEPLPWQVANAKQVAAAESRIGDAKPSVVAEDDPESGATRISIFTPDREGLFYRICAGLAAGGANIIDARIHTTRDGLALDNLLVLDGRGQRYSDRRLRSRLVKSVEQAISSREPPRLTAPEGARLRSGAFRLAPSVTVADRASSRTTVVEVNALDRPALLAGLAAAIHAQGHQIHSAHIATYGERAVDVFYLTRANGKKLEGDEIDALRAALLDAASEQTKAAAAA